MPIFFNNNNNKNSEEKELKERLYKPYEIYGPHEVIKTLSDPGHWEKKCWITMYNKKFLLPADYGANDESTLKMGPKQPSPMKPALRNQNVQENSIV